MMLNPQAWHVRWFNLVQKIIGDRNKYRSGTNLCHFIRVTMLWGPLVCVAFAMAASFVAFLATILLIIIPYKEGGGLWGVFLLWSSIALGCGIVYGALWLLGNYGHHISSKLAPVGSMAHCVAQHAAAVKGKFCPIISFNNSP